jgi:hypothetical protein
MTIEMEQLASVLATKEGENTEFKDLTSKVTAP